MRASCWLAVCALLLAGFCANAAGIQTGPVPAWVRAIAPGKADSPVRAAASGGSFYLLSDRQVRLDGPRTQTYRRFVAQALNAQGLDEIANLQIQFDPAYQGLTMHSIRVTRDGRIQDRLAQVDFQLLQRESDLERQVYDETRTANAFLKDIRVGDIVDYDYTIAGSNPVFGDHGFGRAGLQFSLPIARVHLRLLPPPAGQLHVRPSGDVGIQPKARAGEQAWLKSDVPALGVDAGAPSWYDPYAEVGWTTFHDWAAVVDWARPLYRVPGQLPAGVREQASEIRRTHATPQAQTAAALRWVQSQIRYLAIAIGSSSHAPNPPARVLERRFGDCKDKTLLLLTLLDTLGIESWPALVHTTELRGLDRQAPSPGAFDHVLVLARVGGRDYWLDPTRPEQQGTLDEIFQPDFERALVVREGVTGLQEMRAERVNLRDVRIVLDASEGFDAKLGLTVTTGGEGAQSDKMRQTLATRSRADMQQDYLNFYAGYYPDISVSAPIDVRDAGHRMEVVEHYTLGSIAKLDEESQRYVAKVYSPDIMEYLSDPEPRVRTAPLALEYPLEVRHLIEIRLPEDWPVEPGVSEVKGQAFEFRRETRLEGDRVTLSDHYRTLADHVPAADIQAHVEQLAQARKHTGFEFWWDGPKAAAKAAPEATPPAPAGLHPGAVLGTLASFAFAFGLALLLYRWDPAPRPALQQNTLRGIGGWLLLPAIGAVLMPLILVHGLYENYGLLEQQVWTNLDEGAAAHAPTMRAMLALTLFVNPLLLALSLLFAWLFFQRRSSAPWIFIAVSLIGVAALGGETLAISRMQDSGFWTDSERAAQARDLWQALIRAAIWVPYFLVSQRVRATFVRRRGAPAAPVAAAVLPVAEAGTTG